MSQRSLAQEIRGLSPAEKLLFLLFGFALLLFVLWDVSGDIEQGISFIHIAVDFFFGLIAASSVLLFAARTGGEKIHSQQMLAKMKLEKTHATLQASQWQYRVEQLQAGLAQEIDDHMTAWKLSAAEKEIGMLLLKGLSLREIAEVRGTSERTVRQQSLAIYSKAAVAGRAELSAFFMEDFLDRKQTIQESRPLDL
jgi:DNA-binding CsgD family transcriptional regulator